MNLLVSVKQLITVAIGAILFSLVGCSMINTIEIQESFDEITVRMLSTDRVVGEMAWLSSTQLVYVGIVFERKSRIWGITAAGEDLGMLAIPAETTPGCNKVALHNPLTLTDDRIAYFRTDVSCDPNIFDLEIWSDITKLLVWDPKTSTVSNLSGIHLPESGIVYFDIAPDLSQGIGSTDSGIQDHLFWLELGSETSIDLGLDRASRPVWSPDGKYIAFYGNKRVPGSPGPNWSIYPRDLMIMPAGCEPNCADEVRILVSGIKNPTSISWSPDGEWLAFSGELGDHAEGVLLFHLDTNELKMIIEGIYRIPRWSPDGRYIAVISPDPERVAEIGGSAEIFKRYWQIYVLDVSKIVNSD